MAKFPDLGKRWTRVVLRPFQAFEPENLASEIPVRAGGVKLQGGRRNSAAQQLAPVLKRHVNHPVKRPETARAAIQMFHRSQTLKKDCGREVCLLNEGARFGAGKNEA